MQRRRLVDQGREAVLSPGVRARVRGRRGRRGRRGAASAQLERGCGVRVDVFLTVLAVMVPEFGRGLRRGGGRPPDGGVHVLPRLHGRLLLS